MQASNQTNKFCSVYQLANINNFTYTIKHTINLLICPMHIFEHDWMLSKFQELVHSDKKGLHVKSSDLSAYFCYEPINCQLYRSNACHHNSNWDIILLNYESSWWKPMLPSNRHFRAQRSRGVSWLESALSMWVFHWHNGKCNIHTANHMQVWTPRHC